MPGSQFSNERLMSPALSSLRPGLLQHGLRDHSRDRDRFSSFGSSGRKVAPNNHWPNLSKGSKRMSPAGQVPCGRSRSPHSLHSHSTRSIRVHELRSRGSGQKGGIIRRPSVQLILFLKLKCGSTDFGNRTPLRTMGGKEFLYPTGHARRVCHGMAGLCFEDLLLRNSNVERTANQRV
jgi:hypothetical protein